MNYYISSARGPRGLTLIELLVVLLILAITTSIAVRMTSSLEDQTRNDATARVLQGLDEAIRGAPNEREPDGTSRVTGFVADMGRLPASLDELMLLPGGTQAFKVWPHKDHFTTDIIYVSSGWRGPYLNLGPGQTEIVDGWGNPLVPLKTNGAAAGLGDPIGGAKSAGSLSGSPDDPYSQIVTRQWGDQSATVSGRFLDDTGADFALTAGSSLVVYFYSPDPANLNADPAVAGVLETPLSPAAISDGYSFTTTAGPRTVRAYEVNGGVVLKKSAPVSLVLKPGGQTRDLVLKP